MYIFFAGAVFTFFCFWLIWHYLGWAAVRRFVFFFFSIRAFYMDTLDGDVNYVHGFNVISYPLFVPHRVSLLLRVKSLRDYWDQARAFWRVQFENLNQALTSCIVQASWYSIFDAISPATHQNNIYITTCTNSMEATNHLSATAVKSSSIVFIHTSTSIRTPLVYAPNRVIAGITHAWTKVAAEGSSSQ